MVERSPQILGSEETDIASPSPQNRHRGGICRFEERTWYLRKGQCVRTSQRANDETLY